MFGELAVGAFVAVLWGAFSYAIAKAKNNEEFSAPKFFKTLWIGLIISAVSYMLGMPMTEVENIPFGMLVTIILDKLAGLLYKPQE